MMYWTLVKTIGSQWERISDAPKFATEQEAFYWAQKWMNENPLQKGLEGVGLRKVIFANGEQNA